MPDGLITVRSAFDPAETKARLLAVFKAKGVRIAKLLPTISAYGFSEETLQYLCGGFPIF